MSPLLLWRSDGNLYKKIAKISNSEVRERNNFPFDEHVDAGNQLQQHTRRPGIKED